MRKIAKKLTTDFESISMYIFLYRQKIRSIASTGTISKTTSKKHTNCMFSSIKIRKNKKFGKNLPVYVSKT